MVEHCVVQGVKAHLGHIYVNMLIEVDHPIISVNTQSLSVRRELNTHYFINKRVSTGTPQCH